MNAQIIAMPYFDVGNKNMTNRLLNKFLKHERILSVREDFEIVENVMLKYTGNATSIEIPEQVKIIGKNAFCDATRINEIYIPEGVEEIDESAFERCKLTALAAENHLGKAVVAGIGAFLACRTLVNDAPADKFLLYLHEDVLRNDGRMIVLNIVSWLQESL